MDTLYFLEKQELLVYAQANGVFLGLEKNLRPSP